MKDNYHISTEKSRLNINLIHNFLDKESYWARGRSKETIAKSIENSLCFGVYIEDKQVGFARMVSDLSVFAWILDLFIIKTHRGKGLGKELMKAIMEHPDLQSIQRWGLGTDDAHGLYEKFGFTLLKHPGKFMEKVSKAR